MPKTKSLKYRKFEMKLDPFCFARLYGDEKYSLQNMVLKMTNFPAELHPLQDTFFEVYSDRVYLEWEAAASILHGKSAQHGDAFVAGLPDDVFLQFVGKLFALIQNSERFQKRRAELEASLLRGIKDYDYNGRYAARKSALDQAASEIEPLPITGAIAVRMTNVSSGFPIIFLSAVIQKSDRKTSSGNSAPFIEGSELERCRTEYFEF